MKKTLTFWKNVYKNFLFGRKHPWAVIGVLMIWTYCMIGSWTFTFSIKNTFGFIFGLVCSILITFFCLVGFPLLVYYAEKNK